MPLAVGSRKPRAALMAMAASMAEPPRRRVSRPIIVAAGWAVAAAPFAPQTVERPTKRGPVMRSPMPTPAEGSGVGAGWTEVAAGGGAAGLCVCWALAAPAIRAPAGRADRKVRRRMMIYSPSIEARIEAGTRGGRKRRKAGRAKKKGRPRGDPFPYPAEDPIR